jgi:GT2 family glycosyltransferase
MPETSVVILNWNGENFLQQFLPVLIQNTDPDIEIVVADNCSTDHSVDILRDKFPAIRLILLDKNYGFAGGYNLALSQLQSRYFVILNSDVEVTPHWITPLIDFLDDNNEVAAVMPKIRSFRQKQSFEYAGAAGGFIDKYGYPFCRGRILDSIEVDNGQYDDAVEVFWTTGACMVIRSKVFFEVGGFDESFFAHMEEIDLCWRMLWKGYKLYCVPQSIVYHVGGGALPAENPFKTYLNFRNNLFLLFKNLEQKKIYSTLLKRSLFDSLAFFNFLIHGKIKFALAIIKAYNSFFHSLHSLKNYREKNINLKRASSMQFQHLIYSKSIIIQYYLKGKKKYSHILRNK